MVVWLLVLLTSKLGYKRVVYSVISFNMPSSDEMFKTFAIFRLVTAFLVTCENADVQ